MLADWYCTKCDKLYEDKVTFGDEKVVCEKCSSECEKRDAFSATFRLKYDNKKDKVSWGAEGYSSSQYYREYDKQATGKYFLVNGMKNEI